MFDFVIWIFVPAILVLVILNSISLIKNAADKRHRTSMHAGFWAGIILFVIALIYQVNIFLQIGFPHKEIYQGFDLWLALIGGAVCFLLFSGGKKIIPPRLSGWIIFVLTFASLYALLDYVCIRSFNEVLLSIILGGALGFFFQLTTSPSSMRDFLQSF